MPMSTRENHPSTPLFLAQAAFSSPIVWIICGFIMAHPPLTRSFILVMHRINASAVS